MIRHQEIQLVRSKGELIQYAEIYESWLSLIDCSPFRECMMRFSSSSIFVSEVLNSVFG